MGIPRLDEAIVRVRDEQETVPTKQEARTCHVNNMHSER